MQRDIIRINFFIVDIFHTSLVLCKKSEVIDFAINSFYEIFEILDVMLDKYFFCKKYLTSGV